MKVLIADDEVHVCSLLKYLIKWDELGLTLAGTFSSGVGVIDYLEKDTADILICDIEMPDMNGIELMKEVSEKAPEIKIIVVSGFRNFDYARSAIQYGAANYLLKPIDENELNEVLREIVSSAKVNLHQNEFMLRAENRLRFISAILRKPINESLEDINKTYDYQFADGMFSVLYVSFPGNNPSSDSTRIIKQMFEEILRSFIADFCNEIEFYDSNEVSSYVIINIEIKNIETAGTVRDVLEDILHRAILELGCKTQSEVYIGISRIVENISELTECFIMAKRASYERFFNKGKRIIFADELNLTDERSELLTQEDKAEFRKLIEAIQPDDVSQMIVRLFNKNSLAFQKAPWMLMDFSMALIECMTEVFKQIGSTIENQEQFYQLEEQEFESCLNVEELRNTLSDCINKEINQRLSEKLENVAAYAQQAKRYIEEHYMEDISLKMLADKIGINPSYLSAIFKSELGMNYSKYLTMVRMEKAKELLRQCELNLTEIARAVGYNRTAYFTSVFKDYTGIKPTEYRRLHQLGVGGD